MIGRTNLAERSRRIPGEKTHLPRERRECYAASQETAATRMTEEAFARVVEPHLAAMLSTASAILGCEHHARDAVQEALLSLWREPDAPPNLRAWLLRTVKHRSLALRRCCARRRRRENQVACCRKECSRCDDPVRTLDGAELRSRFAEACTRLPPEFREVFVLREIEELDYEAIAFRMSIPIGTVRSRLNRSRQALRDILEPGGAASR